jgi:hypothetical protein
MALTEPEHDLWDEAEKAARIAGTMPELAVELAHAHLWDRVENVPITARATRAMVMELARAGQWDQADRVAHMITQNFSRSWTISELVDALVNAGDWERAENLAHDGKLSRSDTARSLIRLARARATAAPEETARLAREAQQLALQGAAAMLHAAAAMTENDDAADNEDESEDSYEMRRYEIEYEADDYQATTLTEIMSILATAQLWAQAEDAALTIANPWRKATALTTLLNALLMRKLWNRAARTLRLIDRQNMSWNELMEIAKAIKPIDSGRAHRLLLIAEGEIRGYSSPTDSERLERSVKETGLAKLANAFSVLQVWHDAERVISDIDDPWKRAAAQLVLVRALSEARHWRDADRISSAIESGTSRVLALMSILADLAYEEPKKAAELAAKANQTIRSIGDDSRRVIMRRSLIDCLARTRKWDLAEACVREESDPGELAELLRLTCTHLLNEISQQQGDDSYRRSLLGQLRHMISLGLTGNEPFELFPLIGRAFPAEAAELCQISAPLVIAEAQRISMPTSAERSATQR